MNNRKDIIFASFENDILDQNGNSFNANKPVEFLEDPIIGKYMKVPGDGVLVIENPELAVGLGDFTLDFWVKIQGANATVSTMPQSGCGLGIWVNSDKRYYIGQGRGSGQSYVQISYNPTGEWIHYAIVRKEGVMYGFVNGMLEGTINVSTRHITSEILHLNALYHNAFIGGTNCYKNVRFSNYARWTDDFSPPDPKNPDSDSCTITEKYQMEDGSELQAATVKTIISGDGYAASAPAIDGYSCIGYKIDGGVLQAGVTATIASVTQNHEVIFVYKVKQQGGCDGGVPAGMVMYFTDTVAPDGWLECNGSAVLRADYQRLFNVVGTKFGAGDGALTFNLPDLRSEFIRGFDSGRGLDTDRQFGSNQKATVQAFDPTKTSIYMIGLYNTVDDDAAKFPGMIGAEAVDLNEYPGVAAAGTNSGTSVRDDEVCFAAVRPRNVALLPCIKY